ncbi:MULTISPECIES: hypothetical protein [Pseudomonas putida group]|uniref:Prophage PssSM-03 n=1 Tax=Pseudomonas monteilii TaxID=76759 RepID=A0A2N1IVS9_9PSED|nr:MULTISPECIES: hypothetical protein [Pseudomonas putida group]PKI24853.1 hypothetical protein CXB65_06105 [Pseudomonas monteilii]POF93154.1 hypothetical protein BGP83_10780 [Pseudomonas putida]RPD93730.1 hypothetical protein EGN69_12465 [Pseudomonas monteilii]
MKNGSYVDYLFGVATGWLGWPPDTAWHTPIPQIMLALDARLDWTGRGQAHGQAPGTKPSTRQSVADKLKSFLRGRPKQ